MRTLGDLATHLANLPSWTVQTLQEDSLDIAPADEPAWNMPEAHSVGEILALFDKNVADARAAIAATSDEAFFKPWTLLSGGSPVFTQPRIAVLRSFVLNHNVHHRAQLGVYLRPNDVPGDLRPFGGRGRDVSWQRKASFPWVRIPTHPRQCISACAFFSHLNDRFCRFFLRLGLERLSYVQTRRNQNAQRRSFFT